MHICISCGFKTHDADVFRPHTADLPLTHKLSSVVVVWIVNKLCIKFLLHLGNFHWVQFNGLFWMAFLPTIKLQLSQLPMIVGSGRVAIRRALFSCVRCFNSIT